MLYGEKLHHLRFANDILLVEDSIGDAKKMLGMLYTASEEVGLNTEKPGNPNVSPLNFGLLQGIV